MTRRNPIFNLWLQCYTQEEIAAECECDQKTVTNIVSGITADLPNFLKSKPAANHLVDFQTPIYNVWKVQNKSNIDQASSGASSKPAEETTRITMNKKRT